ncbi:hypothetical protein T265_15550, partial [Opisthorchis viverrini]
KVEQFLKKLTESLDEAEKKLQTDDEEIKQKLSETLLKTLEHLKEEITKYLSELIKTITSEISSLDGNQTQAKGVASIYVINALKNINDFLTRELQRLKEALEQLNEKLEAFFTISSVANSGARETLGDQLNTTLKQAEEQITMILKNVKTGLQSRLSELETKLKERSADTSGAFLPNKCLFACPLQKMGESCL